MANNGWIWNGNPLVDFAGPLSKAYYLRELIPWGDCVKLRYGKQPVFPSNDSIMTAGVERQPLPLGPHEILHRGVGEAIRCF